MLDVVVPLAGPRPGRVPAGRRALPVRARTGPTGRTCPRPTTSCERLRARGRRALPRQGAAGGGQPVARGCGGVLRRRRRVPHVLPLPADAAHVHGPAPRGAPPRWRSILASIPTIPEGCQWGIFLRNHDELTLEMVTDEERDYMYQRVRHATHGCAATWASAGACSRCVDNDRRQAELLHSLLFSLPGTPILYYGDEIGMGDNIYLGDRDGVRTPMQWNPDRNGGFSTRRLRPALPAAVDGPGVRVRGAQRRVRADATSRRSCNGCGS